jgi:hypothetical protein
VSHRRVKAKAASGQGAEAEYIGECLSQPTGED